MTNLTQLTAAFGKGIKHNSPVILSVAAGVGVIATAYLTAHASYQAALMIKAKEDVTGTLSDPKERAKERAQLVWRLFVPSAISIVTTIGAIAGANRVGSKKTLAATTALAFSERAYSEYRDKVVQEYGARKDQAIRDQVISDQVKSTAPSQEVLVTGPGDILCCELLTMRYFKCDMETLRKSVNNINAKMLTHDYQTLNDFYYMIGLAYTSESGRLGWESSKLMELSFSTALTEDGRPCITFEYNYTKIL
jgi:hypothetical protein